ncbi:HxlR family transcriptional regulator [Gottschalkia purinilytica]|uniref:HxlR family transcriptional regulator n=1 Tax=Gottschalkia purinilytica TaxID=1503 RepID=A0A0L0WCG0_GOTPU|nr:helix-turn-helix domain-containing protein [Gottschalkia purinilytica]KNF09095.1 HxlR family transcriptional regulator [Gottschalkia purinilytica]
MDTLCRSRQAPFEYTLSIIGGKWKMRIIYELGCERILRYGELKRNIPYITHKMLSTQLKELESDGLIIRKEYPQIPPKVEYSLSEKGLSLLPIINEMCKWGRENASEAKVELIT